MKKVVSVVAMLLVCMVALCACTPSEDSLKKKFEKNDYKVESVNASDMTKYGIESDKVDYCFMAVKGTFGIGAQVYVISFKNSSDAKEYYNAIRDKESALGKVLSAIKYKTAKKGNAVVFGSEEAVKLV